jgi:hypothetical protein
VPAAAIRTLQDALDARVPSVASVSYSDGGRWPQVTVLGPAFHRILTGTYRTYTTIY